MSGVFSTDPKATDFYARTDSRLFIVKDTDWFIFPYPGMEWMRYVTKHTFKEIPIVLSFVLSFINLFVFLSYGRVGNFALA